MLAAGDPENDAEHDENYCGVCADTFSESSVFQIPCPMKHKIHTLCAYRLATERGPRREQCPFCTFPFKTEDVVAALAERDSKEIESDPSLARDYYLEREGLVSKKRKRTPPTKFPTLERKPSFTFGSLLQSTIGQVETVRCTAITCKQCSDDFVDLYAYIQHLQKNHGVVFMQIHARRDVICSVCRHSFGAISTGASFVELCKSVGEHYDEKHPKHGISAYLGAHDDTKIKYT